MPEGKTKVYLDSNVVIEAGKPPGGPLFERLADLVEADLIEVITTDLTIAEVAKRHTINDYDAIKDIAKPHFRKLYEEHIGGELPQVTREGIRDSISQKYKDSVSDMFDGLGAKVLEIDDVRPSTVFTSYAEGSGFFSADGKKDQFPDAFIFECLKSEATADSPVIIVSKDGDFSHPVQSEDHISLVSSIPELFQTLGLQVEAPEIEGFLEENDAYLLDKVDSELNDWWLVVSDVEDGEIEEISVKNVEPVDLISFGSAEEGGDILIVGGMNIVASVTYSHPNWDEAMWDSEDKVLIPFESVSGVTEIELQADFSMSIAVDETAKATEIELFRFRNDKFVHVDLYPAFDPYM